MNFSLRSRNTVTTVSLLIAAILSPKGFASVATFETIGLTPVRGGDVIGETFSFYVTTFDELAYSNENAREYVVFDGLNLLTTDENDEDDEDDDTYVYTGEYHGYNTATQTVQDEGRLIIESSVDEVYIGGSYITGFIRTSGPWTKLGEDTSNLMANASGTITYTTLEKNRDADIVFNGIRGDSPFVLYGDTTLVVGSEDAVTLSSWTADVDSDYEFTIAAVYLARNETTGNTYEGFIKRNDSEEPEDWTQRYGSIRVVDDNDVDGDGIPNLSDLGAEDVYGVLTTNSISISEGLIWSDDLNTYVYYNAKELWLYGANLGWFYLPDQDDPSKIRIFVPDEKLGWLCTNNEISPMYVRESDAGSVCFAQINGVVRYYDYTTGTWCDLQY